MINVDKINFCAGYGDPNRTIRKKYSDYDSINSEMEKYNTLNKELQGQISLLQQEITLTIQSYQNSPEQDKNEIEQKINVLKQEIENLKDQIEDNRAKASAIWYGFHERL